MKASFDHILHQFEISHYGFLPVDEPLSKLPENYYQPWEELISQLPQLIQTGKVYHQFQNLALLSTDKLRTIPEWRRAYVILTFFTHAHIWSDRQPREVLPPNIALPLLKVSEFLGLPPTATYPALNLWNCGLVSENADITNPENVVMRHTFTGTRDEEWFYAVSVSVEAKGIEAIQLMLECVDSVNQQDNSTITACLQNFSRTVTELGTILQRMHDYCKPTIFYHRIRPFLAGSRGMEKAGLPRGIFYDEGNGKGSWRQYSGGSNAQSTLIQFLDIALGVTHKATGTRQAQPNGKRSTYLDEMREYMPQSHRSFLEHFSKMANVRQHAQLSTTPMEVHKAFDDAVNALTKFRDIHIQIVARYIVAPSRATNYDEHSDVKNIASASSGGSSGRRDLKGTGGTDLMSFLKQTRNETQAAKRVQVAT